MTRRMLLVPLALLLLTQVTPAQRPFTSAFPPEEFAARRTKLMNTIGNDAIVVLRGAPETQEYYRFRQNSHFFYLTGVEVANAMLLLDGRTKEVTLFLPPRDEAVERMDGPTMLPGDEAAKTSGIALVVSTERFGERLAAAGRDRKYVYAPFRREALNSAAPENTVGHRGLSVDDAWDGRPSRETAFIDKVRAVLPQAEVRDLDKVLDQMRVVKSPREIEVMREANRIAARAIEEMMRSTKPGMHEYELEAIGQYFYHQADALQGYYAQVIAEGKGDRPHGRYHSLENVMKSTDMVSVDFGPDYDHYVADITRVFPVSGKYTPEQREATTIFLKFWKDLEQTIRPNVPPGQIVHEASLKMEKDLAGFSFVSPKVRDAATAVVERMKNNKRNYFGHFVGLDVHDVPSLEMGEHPTDVLKPGMVFSIEFGLSLSIPDDGVFAHMEDNYVVTENGVEDLTASLPRDPDAIEKTMAEHGIFSPLRTGTR